MEFQERFRDFFESLDPDYMDKEKFVPATGSFDADVFLIGEAPGAQEVKEKEPFVGRAGKKMNKVLEDLGISRGEIYITNLVKVRPPDNRDPRKDEIEAWRPLLEKEIEKVDPNKIVTLGNFATKEKLDTDKGITQIHGEIFQNNGIKIIPVYHPAATLYDRDKLPEFKEDLKKVFDIEGPQKKLNDI